MQREILVFIVATALAMPLHAITDNERSALQRLYSELEASMTIIDAAEQAASREDRRKVNYVQLRGDVDKVLKGLRDAINSERREPRSLPPIEGEY